MPEPRQFHEANLWTVAIRDLGLTIEGTRLEPIVAAFAAELERAGIRRLRPRFYLSMEWGVPFDTIAVAIPFYLAREELARLHEEQTGHVEGFDRADILRYLRHEMGHAVNYGYRLYEDKDWVAHFGSITQPYVDDYRPAPFSRRFVRHLPGWYAQKHPDEDWAENFAVWMTPGAKWRQEYAEWPEALAKLRFCDRTMKRLRDQEPAVTDDELDEDVGEVTLSVEQFYRQQPQEDGELPPGLDGALAAIFADGPAPADGGAEAAGLIAGAKRDLVANVYRWTGHFPERTRELVRHLEARARELALGYPEGRAAEATMALTTFVTALAMNYVHRGAYMP